ncbi:hypothetical protein EVAR_68691_1 [Eumeta japonica]|uniref:Uncharacterized protein n=1 Tax=Eumeta variegata TaxID=151549 RepID=A0A4C2AE69_EUMVA|nr:hypothetical protein EVAR_68691_1 [Eumeta japonica]
MQNEQVGGQYTLKNGGIQGLGSEHGPVTATTSASFREVIIHEFMCTISWKNNKEQASREAICTSSCQRHSLYPNLHTKLPPHSRLQSPNGETIKETDHQLNGCYEDCTNGYLSIEILLSNPEAGS